KVAESLGARVFVRKNSREFEARNYGVKNARAPLLIFSCADVIFPSNSLMITRDRFRKNSSLAAFTGPDVPYDGGTTLRLVYLAYNTGRFLFSRLPRPFKAFSSSTNFLVVRKAVFDQSGGFKSDDINADGLMGRYLSSNHRVRFDNGVIVYISARRASSWGISRFSRHYLYVLENFFPRLSRQGWFNGLKTKSGKRHGDIHVSQ
ncbi:MAG TPA: hypothetical protein VE177_08280, partial [Candidatus Binatus sp.]|nr:hypothetical protein [Candidatus Binatus sp.]